MGITETLKYDLVVVQDFAGYVKGQIISDAAKVKELLESEWRAHVQKTARTEPDAKPVQNDKTD